MAINVLTIVVDVCNHQKTGAVNIKPELTC